MGSADGRGSEDEPQILEAVDSGPGAEVKAVGVAVGGNTFKEFLFGGQAVEVVTGGLEAECGTEFLVEEFGGDEFIGMNPGEELCFFAGHDKFGHAGSKGFMEGNYTGRK